MGGKLGMPPEYGEGVVVGAAGVSASFVAGTTTRQLHDQLYNNFTNEKMYSSTEY